MSPVHEFISEHEGLQKVILEYFHNLISTYPGIEPKIKFGIPFYYRKKWICYLNPKKENAVELAFTRGNELSNEQGMLDFKGRKQICGITCNRLEDIDENAVREIIQEAILLDEKIPYQSPGKRKSHK